jgi:crotonobetainyl-CoA:carnitine CoA-transferase CaiB-like acyl-CoA transferase
MHHDEHRAATSVGLRSAMTSGQHTGADPPLAGVRVLDCTRLLPGPMCTLYLADLGADVIKVEDTRAGDYARSLGADAAGASSFYRSVNRGKRSIAVDLKDARGRAALLAMTRSADVMIESFRPGVMRALGLDYPAVAALRPSIVYCSLSGYGQDGPRAGSAGHDVNYLGYAGVLEQTGVHGGSPALANLQIADLLGGAASAAIAVLAALVGARATGRGRYLDVAMADATLAHAVFILQALEQHGGVPARGDDLLTGGVPCYGVYATSDGRFLAVGALEAKFWHALCNALDRPDLFAGQMARGTEGARVRASLEQIFAAHTQDYWVRTLGPVDCCVTPVLDFAAALEDAQFGARGMVARRADGSRELAPPFRVGGHPFVAGRPAPAQGEHTRAVLREAGYADADIDVLVQAGVVRSQP